MQNKTEYILEVRDAAGATTRVPLAGQRMVIGRAPDAAVQLDRGLVSRHHAEIVSDPFGRWWLRDLNSTNGTMLNGVRIKEQTLSAGDAIRIGEFTMTLVAPGTSHSGLPASTGAIAVRDTDAGQISSLAGAEVPRLAASHLAMLSEFGQQLLGVHDHGQRMTSLCKMMVRPEFKGRMAVVMRVYKEPLNEPPKMLCGHEVTEGAAPAAPYISRSLMKAILVRNEPVLACNASPGFGGRPTADMAELSLAPEVQALSTLAVPIRGDERSMDVLYAIMPPECGTFEWLALASLATKQFQQAEATLAAKQAATEHAAIEAELERARQIQLRLVPQGVAIPGLDFAIGFKPCKWVGGDYVDVVRTKEGRTILTVADVCGKGMPAALIASAVHTMVHTLLRIGLTLPELMRNLNEHLCDTLESGTFVTMCAVELYAETGKMRCINAGHPPVLVVDGTGKLEELQSEANFPLGLERAEFEVQETELLPGSLMTLYTDGITELPTNETELLGQEKLGECLQNLYVKEKGAGTGVLAGELTGLLDKIQGERLSQDDRTFLLARRVG